MDIFGVLKMIGGLALFLYGMTLMGDSLTKLSGGKLESILERLTSNRFKGLLLGLVVTGIIQSSSATTVMVVGFVNSGIMQLSQAVGVIMGANIGTTVTSWLLSLTGVSGDNLLIQMLNPSSFSPILAAIGVILLMTAQRSDKKKGIGCILLGFAILMFGMETMSDAVAPLAQNEQFTGILTMFSHPILGLLAGMILTAIIQSSSASVGILQSLCLTGAVTYGTAIPIIMGQNIGTCITAILSSVGASRNAKRASMIHLYFNLIGSIVFMTVFYTINSFIHFSFLGDAASVFGIAVIHSMFNIVCATCMFPFANQLVRLATISVRDKKETVPEQEEKESLPAPLSALDERFLDQPGFAMELARKAAFAMAEKTRTCIFLALELCRNYSEERIGETIACEQTIDVYEDVLGTYLVKLSSRNLSQADSRTMSLLLHCISDFERISDHAVNLCESVKELKESGQEFSPDARKEYDVLLRAVRDIVEKTVTVFLNNDLEGARGVEPLEEVIDDLDVTLRQNHIRRVRKGKCTIELGLSLEDMIINLERVSDHCSNIAVCMIEVSGDEFETHEYIDSNLKQTRWFADEVNQLKAVYTMPQVK